MIKKILAQELDKIQNIGIPTFKWRSGGRTDVTPARVITDVLPYIFGIAGIILVLNIIVSGYQLMTSAGDPKAAQAAQGKITTSVIGIVIILISFWLVNIVLNFFGINMTVIN